MNEGRLHGRLPAELEAASAEALVRDTDREGIDEFVTHALVTGGTSRNLQHAEALVSSKLKNKVILLDQPDRKPTTARQSGQMTWKRPPLTTDKVLYKDALILKELWEVHAKDVLELGRESNENRALDVAWVGERITRMDFHGATMKVTRARDPSLIGKEGIIIMETANTFVIVTERDKSIRIPKAHIRFSIRVLSCIISVNGGAILYRASERSARRFKKKQIEPL